MRILHVSESLDPAHGGTPAVPKALACAMAGLGHEVTILTRDEPDRAAAIRDSMSGMPGTDRVVIATVPALGGSGRFVNRAADRWVREHAGGFDFAHLHSMWSPIPHGAARGLRRNGTPYTICPHGMLDHWNMRRSRLKKRLHLALVSGRTLRGAAFIHALNAHEAACVERFGAGRPIRVFGNGVFPQEFDAEPDPALFLDATPALADRPYVLFLGRLHLKKGLDLLADAFASIARVNPRPMLVVAGPDGGEERVFRQRVESHGIADRVLIVGPLYGDQKFSAIAGAACFCLPSRQEGFSVAVCEAMASGTPVVMSTECHFDDAGEADAAVVTTLDPAVIADAIGALLDDPAAGAELGSRGRAFILSRYTWPEISRRLLGAYGEHSGGDD